MSSINTNERSLDRLSHQRNVANLTEIPYQYGASSLEGCDCWGLVVCYYKQLGISLPDFPRPTHEESFLLNVAQMAVPYFREIATPKEPSIAVGMSINNISFGVWEDCSILTTFYGRESCLISWEMWKRLFKSTIFFVPGHSGKC